MCDGSMFPSTLCESVSGNGGGGESRIASERGSQKRRPSTPRRAAADEADATLATKYCEMEGAQAAAVGSSSDREGGGIEWTECKKRSDVWKHFLIDKNKKDKLKCKKCPNRINTG